ncbi:MAG: betaine--homocysteine S-methyltransferase [Pseudomonadota bacterium]
MSSALSELLSARPWLLADGATGTNFFAMGLQAGDPPEMWNLDAPENVHALHRGFVEAGSDIILTNSFGANRRRLMLHNNQDQAFEVNKAAAEIARAEADAVERPVLVAGSMGPTGDILEPVGELTHAEAVEVFTEQAAGLKAGGADLLWIETLSSQEEAAAAVEGAATADLPIAITLSFDTAGRTMMGISPSDWPGIATSLPASVAAIGANCGVGASELVATVLNITKSAETDTVVISKANAGIPEFKDGAICYNGTPELMADYARLAADSGARIIGGCCGTSATHIAAMRAALDAHKRGETPSIDTVIARLGEVSDLARGIDKAAEGGGRKRRRRA